LVDGEIVTMSRAGERHGIILVKLSALLWIHVDKLGLGEMVGCSTGAGMPNDNLRSPDLAFTSRARLASESATASSPSCPT
jgi:Uma2 family endonuclease